MIVSATFSYWDLGFQIESYQSNQKTKNKTHENYNSNDGKNQMFVTCDVKRVIFICECLELGKGPRFMEKHPLHSKDKIEVIKTFISCSSFFYFLYVNDIVRMPEIRNDGIFELLNKY